MQRDLAGAAVVLAATLTFADGPDGAGHGVAQSGATILVEKNVAARMRDGVVLRSYSATTQPLAAPLRPPHLVAIFPFDRNPNTGAAFGDSAELSRAEQTVFHDAQRPSRLVLPVVPR